MSDEDSVGAYIDQQMREPPSPSVRPVRPWRRATTSGDWRPAVSEACSRETPVITQAMLEELLREKAHVQNYDRLHKQILQRFEDGAAVEEGRLDVRIERSRQQRLTDAVLTTALGAARVAELKAGAAPTVFRRLIVTDPTVQAEP